jgi:hypothetical protein
MKSDTLKPVAAVATAIILTGLMTTTTVARADAFNRQEHVTVSAGDAITPENEAALSAAAAKALRHLAKAKEDLASGQADAAEHQLNNALAQLDLIEAKLPTAVIKDQIRVASRHLQSEDAKDIVPDLTPIYRSLAELKKYMPVQQAKQNVDRAKEHLKNNDKDKAKAELDAAGSVLVLEELDLPLSATRNRLAQANEDLRKGDIASAETALKAAENSTMFLSVAVHEPLVKAHRSLCGKVRD